MGKKRKNDIGFLTGVILTVLFAVAAIMFALHQYEFSGGGYSFAQYTGFTMSFGKGNYEGFFLFFLAFLFAIFAAVAAILAALRVLKINGRILFAVCAALALGSVIIYIVEYVHIINSYKGIIDLSKGVKWTFAFWTAFALNCVALAGSAYGAVTSKK